MYLWSNLVSLTALMPTRLKICRGPLIETLPRIPATFPARQYGPTTHLRALSGGKPFVNTCASVTAGLKWPPDVGPQTLRERERTPDAASEQVLTTIASKMPMA